MKFLCINGIFFALVSALSSAQDINSIWTATLWQNEPAWIGHQGPLTAVVSKARGRLVYFGGDSLGQTGNLIFAPTLVKEITGSHAVWLGPQTLWGWPPPKDWDSPASKAETSGGTIRLTAAHVDSTYPQLVRTYTFAPGKLICGACWGDTEKPYYAMQIIQVPSSAQCSLKLNKSSSLPQGAVLVEQNVHANPSFTMPTHGVKVSPDGNELGIVPEEPAIKIGVTPQAIIAREGDWTLSISRGEVVGQVHDSPDFGCLTQIWTGSPALGYYEAEQFSPVLVPPNIGPASFSIILEATKSSP